MKDFLYSPANYTFEQYILSMNIIQIKNTTAKQALSNRIFGYGPTAEKLDFKGAVHFAVK